MDTEIDHYAVLGLSSGEEGAKLTEKEISKAYRSKALELHPDKRPDDPNAHANFQKLKTSYEILKDEKARKLFDDLVRVKQDKLRRQTQQDSKRRKMMSDLEERERGSAYDSDPGLRAKAEEERITRKLQEEINRIRSQFTNKGSDVPASKKKNETNRGAQSNNVGKGSTLDKERVLKVSWEKTGVDYSVERLKDIFGKFGTVEDVLIKSSKKKGSALLVMATRDAAVAATGNVLGDISNPLLVLPLQPTQSTPSPLFSFPPRNAEPSDSSLSNLVGSGYQAFENSVLEKMKKAAQNSKTKTTKSGMASNSS